MYFDNTENRPLCYVNGNRDMIGFNMFAYCSNNPVMYCDLSGCGKIWNWIKKVLGIGNKTTNTSKKQTVIKGSDYFVEYSSGAFTSTSSSSTSNKDVSIYHESECENQNSITNTVGVSTETSSFGVQLSSEGSVGLSISSNTQHFSGSVGISKSFDYTNITVTECTNVKVDFYGGETSNGVYHNVQINNHAVRTAKVVVACVAIFVVAPASAPVILVSLGAAT